MTPEHDALPSIKIRAGVSILIALCILALGGCSRPTSPSIPTAPPHVVYADNLVLLDDHKVTVHQVLDTLDPKQARFDTTGWHHQPDLRRHGPSPRPSARSFVGAAVVGTALRALSFHRVSGGRRWCPPRPSQLRAV